MSDTPQSPDSAVSAADAAAPVSPLRCIGGSLVAGVIAFGLYGMTSSIAQTFASKPITSDNMTTQRIASAVRTLVIGLSALGTGIFGLAALGLFALGIQLLIQKLRGGSVPPTNPS